MENEYKTFNHAMDTILKADPAKVKSEMEADKLLRAEARIERSKAAMSKELEAKLDRRAAKIAKALQGHIHFSGTDQPGPAVRAFNETMKKVRLRKVN